MEIGFGNGRYISEILNKKDNLFYYGLDFSSTMVKQAEELIASQHLNNAEAIEADLSNNPFPNNTFDIALTINTIYFWNNPLEDAKEIYRVLKD